MKIQMLVLFAQKKYNSSLEIGTEMITKLPKMIIKHITLRIFVLISLKG